MKKPRSGSASVVAAINLVSSKRLKIEPDDMLAAIDVPNGRDEIIPSRSSKGGVQQRLAYARAPALPRTHLPENCASGMSYMIKPPRARSVTSALMLIVSHQPSIPRTTSLQNVATLSCSLPPVS
jgi:hypothetical protein